MVLVKNEAFEDHILELRGQSIILDASLAILYRTDTKVLNQAVKRNYARFPSEFMFQLTKEEKQEVVTNCDHLKNLKFSRTLPYAFTEHGAIMLASILNSDTAIKTSIKIVKAFIKMRNFLVNNNNLFERLSKLEKKVGKHDENFKALFIVIQGLTTKPRSKTNKVGFI